MKIRSYSELSKLRTMKERFDYLALKGVVGDTTFGFDRFMNQKFYTSTEWRNVRYHVIARDLGCDLGVDGYEIHDKIIIHHMNPITVADLSLSDPAILDPEFLISVRQRTHNAIHYGDSNLLPKDLVERKPGDTKLW